MEPWSHSSTTKDAKGYLIVVDLASKLPMPQRSRVYGPLWSVPQSRSTISFDAGANFTKEDVAAAAATPLCKFENGELVVSPRAIWNEGFGATIHRTFELHGEALSREECFLCADSPEPSLGIVHRKADKPELLAEASDDALTVDHRLLLLFATNDAVRLERRHGGLSLRSEGPQRMAERGTGQAAFAGRLRTGLLHCGLRNHLKS